MVISYFLLRIFITKHLLVHVLSNKAGSSLMRYVVCVLSNKAMRNEGMLFVPERDII